MKQIIIICATLLAAACNRTPQPVPAEHVASTITPASSAPASVKIKLDCKAKDVASDSCKVYIGMQNAPAEIRALAALLGSDMDLDKYNIKNDKPTSPSEVWAVHSARLDAATAGITDAEIKSQLQQFRAAYEDCENKVSKARQSDLNDDRLDLQDTADSCAFPLQRQADAIGVALGIQVAATPPDIFGMTWGMSVTAALEVNSKPIERDADSLAYKSTINGGDANVVLIFVHGKLAHVFYMMKAEHANPLPYIGDFEEIDGLLKDKYGSPSTSGPQWADDLYKDDQSQWGMAVATHRMQMRSEWETPRTKIIHFLSGDNFKVNHEISYQSRELKLAETQAVRNKHKSQL